MGRPDKLQQTACRHCFEACVPSSKAPTGFNSVASTTVMNPNHSFESLRLAVRVRPPLALRPNVRYKCTWLYLALQNKNGTHHTHSAAAALSMLIRKTVPQPHIGQRRGNFTSNGCCLSLSATDPPEPRQRRSAHDVHRLQSGDDDSPDWGRLRQPHCACNWMRGLLRKPHWAKLGRMSLRHSHSQHLVDQHWGFVGQWGRGHEATGRAALAELWGHRLKPRSHDGMGLDTASSGQKLFTPLRRTALLQH